jgi:hypothetical protein
LNEEMKYEAFLVHVEVTTLVLLEQAVRDQLHKPLCGLTMMEHTELQNLANEIRARLQHLQDGYAPSGDFDPAGVEALFTPEALKLDREVLIAALSWLIYSQQPPVEDWLA